MSKPKEITMGMSVVLTAAKGAGGVLERAKSGYWRVPGQPTFYNNDIVRNIVALGAMRYTKKRHYRGKIIGLVAEVVN